MNNSQLIIYEKIKEMQFNRLNNINDILIELELVIDHADLTEQQYEQINEAFTRLQTAINDLSESI
jgi:hypothetical protein